MSATLFRKVRSEATKHWESCGMVQKHLIEHSALGKKKKTLHGQIIQELQNCNEFVNVNIYSNSYHQQ